MSLRIWQMFYFRLNSFYGRHEWFLVNEMTLKNYIFKNLWLQVIISLLVGLGVGMLITVLYGGSISKTRRRLALNQGVIVGIKWWEKTRRRFRQRDRCWPIFGAKWGRYLANMQSVSGGNISIASFMNWRTISKSYSVNVLNSLSQGNRQWGKYEWYRRTWFTLTGPFENIWEATMYHANSAFGKLGMETVTVMLIEEPRETLGEKIQSRLKRFSEGESVSRWKQKRKQNDWMFDLNSARSRFGWGFSGGTNRLNTWKSTN